MLCGKWESFPREFAKCRRCRKAKYCGKECQSRAWSEGHRFWCSAREADDAEQGAPIATAGSSAVPPFTELGQSAEEVTDNDVDTSGAVGGSRMTLDRIERRQARDRERQRMSTAAVAVAAAMQPAPSAASALAVARNPSTVSG